MPDDSPLSLESAAGLLIEKPEETKSQTADEALSGDGSANETAGDAAAAAESPENTDASADESSASEADTDTLSDAGETEGDDGDQGDALPSIEAPTSWKAEEKTVWDSLPRKAQEAIQRREQDRTNELRNLQNSTAEQRKAADAEVTRLKGLATQIDSLVNTQAADIAAQFPELRSEADLHNLAASDPARFAQFQAKLMTLNAAAGAQERARAELDATAQKTQQETFTKAAVGFVETFPHWKNPEVARRESRELQDYAITLGAPEEAVRSSIDPFVYKLAHKAMLYDRAQAKKSAAIVKDPPRVIKPGSGDANPKKTAQADVRQKRLGKLDQTGDIEDAIGLLRM